MSNTSVIASPLVRLFGLLLRPFIAAEKAVDGWICSWNPYDPAQLKDKGLAPVQVEESQIRKSAARWFFLSMIAFLAWAFYAPIDAGVNVSGNVTVSGYRKSVQHPGGGVVQDILVKEGAQVRQGDVLIRVNPLNTEANLASAELQYINLLVTESRLKSERLGKAAIDWTRELDRWTSDPRAKEAKALQVELLNSRRAEYANQLSGLQVQAAGLTSAIAAKQVQLKTLAEEMVNTQKLADEGLVARNQANQALRSKSELESSLATAQADFGKTRAQIAQQQTSYMRDIDNQLAEVQKNREAYQGKFEAAKFDRTMAEIRAPVSGTVVGLKVYTVGGVLSSGQVLMEIVPEDSKLVVEAQVPTNLIDKVHIGLDADMRFTAFNQTTTPVIPGKVKLVGADKQKSEGGQQQEYYLAQVELTDKGLSLLGELKLQPGMPVDVLVKTGERSFMSYLMKPLSDKFSKAFKD
ncbi:membrane fusion protein HasE [Noviherbaspirillum humi]|uniref:Membrane fusion protein (MFP) family protein n=1 Tax=Noviherbaspirillum humi TaxID=1688639 RepID=A0A239K290_9BURK|nr:HlyD family type I secretion periplasmic adaptor subunit [Noviherbaspirillum humi]SNT11802.1 membrane fusion protein HasE [Noviherbaspirillum humi]